MQISLRNKALTETYGDTKEDKKIIEQITSLNLYIDVVNRINPIGNSLSKLDFYKKLLCYDNLFLKTGIYNDIIHKVYELEPTSAKNALSKIIKAHSATVNYETVELGKNSIAVFNFSNNTLELPLHNKSNTIGIADVKNYTSSLLQSFLENERKHRAFVIKAMEPFRIQYEAFSNTKRISIYKQNLDADKYVLYILLDTLILLH